MVSVADTPFARTECACPTCVECCKDQPGCLMPGDLERIAAFLHLPVRTAALKFWASPGAVLLNGQTGATFRVGTITPRRVQGQCIFLKDDRCTIHPVAPAGCALFDTHQSPAEGQRRGLWLVRQQAQAAYQSLRRTLVEATWYKPRWVQ
jgi:Fe-S-cluster containining protein